MQQTDALIVEYGPKFHGMAVRTDDGIVCIIPGQTRQRPHVQASMREMVRELGGECGRCPNCPLGSEG